MMRRGGFGALVEIRAAQIQKFNTEARRFGRAAEQTLAGGARKSVCGDSRNPV
jgi:hypothetical protein